MNREHTGLNALDFTSFEGRRVFVFSGGLGSGKTEITLNFSAALRAHTASQVFVVDLDIINPYFRSRHERAWLEERGIELLAPPGELAYTDVPVLPHRLDSILALPSAHLVVDVGGDAAGARVLARYRDEIEAAGYEHFFVFNARRPFSGELEGALRMFDDLERSSALRYTALVHNTHLMRETTWDIVDEGRLVAGEIARRREIPISFTGVASGIARIAEETRPGEMFLPLAGILTPEWV